MGKRKIGVFVDNLKLGVQNGIKRDEIKNFLTY